MRAPGVILLVAGLSGATAVAVGALAAHLSVAGGTATAAGHLVDTGLRYHLLHAAALLALAAVARAVGGRWVWAIAGCWLGGTILFSGGLYLHGFGGVTALGPVVPVGGLLYIAGWVLVAAFGIVVLARPDRD